MNELSSLNSDAFKDARVAVIGVGSLGCLLAQNLARSNAAEVLLIDHDVVEEKNLETQVLYGRESIDQPKAVAAAEQLSRLNLNLNLKPPRFPKVTPKVAWFMERNARSLLNGIEYVFCAVDNLESRRVINRVCLELGIPWTYGAADGDRSEAMLILPRVSACYECMLPRGVDSRRLDLECVGHNNIRMPPLIMAASCCLELARSRNQPGPHGRRYMFDLGNEMSLTQFPVPRDRGCPICGKSKRSTGDNPETYIHELCGGTTLFIPRQDRPKINLDQIIKFLPMHLYGDQGVIKSLVYIESSNRPASNHEVDRFIKLQIQIEETKAGSEKKTKAGCYDARVWFWEDGRLFISPRWANPASSPSEESECSRNKPESLRLSKYDPNLFNLLLNWWKEQTGREQ